jgi:hypothetical protein
MMSRYFAYFPTCGSAARHLLQLPLTWNLNNPRRVALGPQHITERALNIWEQDARQLLTASNEGMPGSEEGTDPNDHHRLGELVRAKDKLGEKPALKTAH